MRLILPACRVLREYPETVQQHTLWAAATGERIVVLFSFCSGHIRNLPKHNVDSASTNLLAKRQKPKRRRFDAHTDQPYTHTHIHTDVGKQRTWVLIRQHLCKPTTSLHTHTRAHTQAFKESDSERERSLTWAPAHGCHNNCLNAWPRIRRKRSRRRRISNFGTYTISQLTCVCFGYVRNEFVKPLQRTHAQRHTHTDNSCQQKLRGA